MLLSPDRNHSNSWMIERRCSFLVVTSGKPAERSKRIWCPNTLSVPVPVRSSLRARVAHQSHHVQVLLHLSLCLPGRAICHDHHNSATRHHRHRQNLAHCDPIERKVAQVRVRNAVELDSKAEYAVQQQEQARYRHVGSWFRRVPPQYRKQDERLRETPRTASTDAASGR